MKLSSNESPPRKTPFTVHQNHIVYELQWQKIYKKLLETKLSEKKTLGSWGYFLLWQMLALKYKHTKHTLTFCSRGVSTAHISALLYKMQSALLKKCNFVKNKHWKHNAIILEFHHSLGYLLGVSSTAKGVLALWWLFPSYEVAPANQSPLTFSWNLNMNSVLHQRSWLLFHEIQVGPHSLCLGYVSGMGRLTTLRKIN